MKSRSQSHEEMLPELSPSQRTLLGELIDQYELAADTGQVLSLENLCENSPELLPHMISSLRRLRAFDVRLATVPSLPLPERIADYVVLEPLGTGATGMVFRCRQQNPDRDVAVKVLKPLLDADEQQLRFTREIAAIAAIREEGIATVYQTGIVEWSGVRCLWIAMELLSGGSITNFLRRHNTNETEKLELFGTIARTIRAAHRVGILHRDIKPSNILMSDDGQPHVVDFGIAKLPGTFAHVQQTETGATSAKGTAAWMAPELLLADSKAAADVRSEIFSLGVLLFEMISGRHPYAAEHLSIPQVSARIAQGEQARLRDIYPAASTDLVAFLDQMMAFNADHRYQNLDDVLSDLVHLQQGEPVRSRRVPLRERVFRWSRRHRGFAASLVALFFAALAIFATLWMTSARIRQQSALLASANEELETRSDRLEQQAVNLQYSIHLRDRSISNGALRSLQYVVENAPFDVQSRLQDPRHFPRDRRSFAWRLMNYESSMSRWNLERVSGAVRQMIFDPRGETLFAASDTGELSIYDMATRRKSVGRVSLHPDGSLIFRQGHSTLLAISDRQQLVELSNMDGSLVQDYGATIAPAMSFAVSSDGELLAGIDTERSLFLANLTDGTVRSLNVTLRKIPAYLWFTDNNSMVNCVDNDQGWRRWDVASLSLQEKPQERKRSLGRLYSADFSPAMSIGPLLAVATREGSLELMSLPGPRAEQQGRIVHGDDRLAVKLLPPNRVVSAGASVQIHQLDQNQPPQIIPMTPAKTQAIAVSADSQIVAMGAEDGSVSLLDMKPPEIRLDTLGIFNGQSDQGFGFPKTLYSLPNSGLTCVGHSGGWFATVDQKTMTAIEAFAVCRGAINSIAAHPEKPIVAVGNGGEDQSVILLKFSPDYRFCQDTSGLIRSSPTPLARIRTDADVRQMAFSKGGDRLIVALRNGDVVTYDAVTWQITSREKCHEGGIYAMDIYEDLMMTGGQDGFVCIANHSDRTQLSRWKAHDNRITCLAVSQDGNRIYTGTHDGDIGLWNRDGRKITSLLAHVGPVLCLELSVDGETLFTGGHDRRILLWDALTGDLQREIAAHTDRVMDLEFLSEEAGLLSSSFDGMLHRWGYRSDNNLSVGTP